MCLVSSFPILKSPSVTHFDFQIVSDAGDPGFLVYCLFTGKKLVSQAFNLFESAQSSTYREMVALHETYTNEDILNTYKGKNMAHCMYNVALGRSSLKK